MKRIQLVMVFILAFSSVLCFADEPKPKQSAVQTAQGGVSHGLAKHGRAAMASRDVLSRIPDSLFVVEVMDGSGVVTSSGNGIAVSPDEVVTNCHLVQGASSVRISQEAKHWAATIDRVAASHDLCQLKVPGLKAQPVTVRPSVTVTIGEPVYAVTAFMHSSGVVSGLQAFDGAPIIQTTVPPLREASGGGLFDVSGKLIGVTTVFENGGEIVNIAVPSEWIAALGHSGKNDNAEAEDTRANEARAAQALQWFTLGSQAFLKGEYAEAVTALTQATQLRPEAFGGWGILGLCYEQLKQYDRSIQAFQVAVRLKPDSAESWSGLARDYGAVDQFDAAIDAAQHALKLRPDDASTYLVLGGAYGMLQRYDEATKVLQQAIRLKPDSAAAWYNLGNVYGSTKEYDKAISAHLEAVRLEPSNAAYWYLNPA